MSKTGKKKLDSVEVIDTSTLSKKELYDLNKKKKEEKNKKTSDKKKKHKKKNNSNLGARIFAIIMLILMIASIFAGAFAYII